MEVKDFAVHAITTTMHTCRCFTRSSAATSADRIDCKHLQVLIVLYLSSCFGWTVHAESPMGLDTYQGQGVPGLFVKGNKDTAAKAERDCQ